MEKHIFSKSLKVGKRGEDTFYQMFKDSLIRLDGLESDFITKNNKTIELKTDFYNPKETPNFFLERWSRNSVDGGPWQALKKGSFYYIYFFIATKEIYIFETKELVDELNVLCKDSYLIPVRNVGFVTLGYKVARESLAHIRKEKF